MAKTLKGEFEMATEGYEKGLEKLKELTIADGENQTGHMDIGKGFSDVAPDLEKYVVEFAFGDIYARPGIDNKQKCSQRFLHSLHRAHHKLVCM